jgi:hypothetical protein
MTKRVRRLSRCCATDQVAALDGAWRRGNADLVDQAEAEEYDGRGDVLQDMLEGDLLALGGQELLDRARDEVGRYVDERYPWDGRGDVPAERVSAWCGVLWQLAEQAREVLAAS